MPDWKPILRERLARLGIEPHREAEIVDELALELEERFAHAVATGAAPAEAEARIRKEVLTGALPRAIRAGLGPQQPRPVSDAGLSATAGKGESIMSDFIGDLRYAARMLVKNPLFTLMAVLSLALGIGANTTIFTLVSRVLLSPLPVREPEQLVSFFTTDAKNSGQFLNFLPTSLLNYRDHRDQNQMLSGLAAYQGFGLSLGTGGEPIQIGGELVTGNYFDVLGVRPAVGRLFSFTPQEDDQTGAHSVVVLSHELWDRRFGQDPKIVGSEILLNRRKFTVLGVTAKGFRGVAAIGGPDLWVPLATHNDLLTGVAASNFMERRPLFWAVVGRLKPGVTIGQAESAAKTIAAQLEKDFPRDNDSRSVSLRPVIEGTFFSPEFRRNVTSGGALMMGVVALILFIACANVANLLLARAASRQREVAVRMSLGASRRRLVRQLITESLLLAMLAGAAGLVMARYLRDLLWSLRPPFMNEGAIDLSLDTRILLFTLGISVATGILFGLFPALQLSRPDLGLSLKDRTSQPSHSNRLFSLRGVLVMVQVALSLVALIGAGLFLRSLQNAQRIDPGFDPSHLAMLSLNTGAAGYSNERAEEFHRQILERVRALPLTDSVALAAAPPMGASFSRTIFRDGVDTSDRRNGRLVPTNQVGVGYFQTAGVAVLRGRAFEETDRAGAPMVALINETMARRTWPGEEAIGKRFRCFGEPWVIEVVGIARDGKYFGLGEEQQQYVYFPLLQHPSPGVNVLARTRTDPESALGAIRGAVQTLDQQLPLTRVRTAMQAMENVLWAPRLGAMLLAAFGVLALLLAAMGVHGVISYNVAQRTQEIGIRMALGARPSDVLGMVMRHTLLTVTLGAAAGLGAAYAAGRSISSMLFGVGGADPLTFAATAALILAVAVVASLLPARRASKVDPLVALRYE